MEIELDGTTDTLPILDHYLSLLRDDPHREEVTGMVVPAVGAYLGQVAQALIDDGAWHCPPAPQADLPPDYASWRLICERQKLSFNPMGIALECATQSDAADWGAHYEVPDALKEQAAAYLKTMAEQVREDDYFRLSVRFEVLEALYTSLSATRS